MADKTLVQNVTESFTLPTFTFTTIIHTSSDTTYYTATDFHDIFYGSFNGTYWINTVSYADTDTAIRVRLELGLGYDGAANDEFHGIKNIYGTDYADKIIGSSADNTFYGNDGDDALYGKAGEDFLSGGAGDDYIDGGDGDDRLRGQDGDDNIKGGDGNDNISGAEGNDTLRGGKGRDELSGGSGVDILRGGKDSDFVMGGEGDDSLYGGGGADFLVGDAGHDKIFGQNGNDLIMAVGDGDEIDGGNGNADLLIYIEAAGGAKINLKEGFASVQGSPEIDTIVNMENVVGTYFDDVITGDDNDNVIAGMLGRDIIDGGEGNDTLGGGGSWGTIVGEEPEIADGHADTFIFKNNDGRGDDEELSHGNDIIVDFEIGIDKIDLSENEVRSFGDLTNGGRREMVQVGDDTVIYTIDGEDGDTITLEDVLMSDLTQDDFIF